MRTEIKLITPQIATELLKKTIINRDVDKRKLSKYIEEMNTGKWREEIGDTIRISKTNRFLDGQHRLRAMIETGKSFVFILVTDIDDDAMPVIDSGKSRTSADVFTINGIKNASGISALIRYYLIDYNGMISQSTLISNQEVLMEYNRRANYWQELFNESCRRYLLFGKILTGTTIGGLTAIFDDVNPTISQQFMEQFCSGRDIENETIALLRNRIISERLSSLKMTPTYKKALIYKTWNAYRSGVTLKVLKYIPSSENFPNIR